MTEKEKDNLPLVLAKDLTPLQVKFVLKLLETGSITKTAENLKMSRQTYYNWNQDESYRKQIREIKNKLFQDTVSDLSFLLIECIEAYRDGLSEDQETKLRVKTANSIIDRINSLEVSEYEDRIRRIEKFIGMKK